MADSFSRLYDIYYAVLDLPDEQRQQFLDQECRNDSTLLEDVKRLLARGDNCSEDLLGAPANLLSLSASLIWRG